MRTIPLLHGYETMVDEEFYDVLMTDRWRPFRSPWGIYVRRSRKLKDGPGSDSIAMHNVVAPPPAGLLVDHINGNGLDNRKINLRIATFAQNTQNSRIRKDNTSGFKGVYFTQRRRKWLAEIIADKKKHYLGQFDTAEEASAAYYEAARELHGDYVRARIASVGRGA